MNDINEMQNDLCQLVEDSRDDRVYRFVAADRVRKSKGIEVEKRTKKTLKLKVASSAPPAPPISVPPPIPVVVSERIPTLSYPIINIT